MKITKEGFVRIDPGANITVDDFDVDADLDNYENEEIRNAHVALTCINWAREQLADCESELLAAIANK